MNSYIKLLKAIKYVVLSILFIILMSCVIIIAYKNNEKHTKSELEQIKTAKKCFESITTDQKLLALENILESPPKSDRTIFFHDTTCARDKNGTVTFTPRYQISRRHSP